MKNLAQEIRETQVPEGSAALWWTGQAGFVFKSSAGTVIYFDCYLSDACESFGFKRLSMSPIDAEDVRADWVISTHEHGDHLDTDAVPVIARNNPNCRFAGSAECEPEYEKLGIPLRRQLIMWAGNSYDLGGVNVRAARSDHGEYPPHSLSLLLDFGNVSVMDTGDTALTMEFLQPLIDKNPDVLLTCINANYGNLSGREAAELTAVTKPRMVIPCHFWMFKEHHVLPGGDPQSFFEACKELCPSVRAELLTPGEGMLITPEEIGFIGQ